MKSDRTGWPRLIEWGLLGIVLLSPTQFGFEIAKKNYLSLVDPLVWAVLALWLAAVRRGRALLPPPGSLVFPVVFVAMAAISMFSSARPLRSASKIVQYMEYFVAAQLLFSSAMRDGKMAAAVRNTFLAVSSAVVVFGFVQYLCPGIPDFGVKAAFGNSNVFGGFISLALPLLFGMSLFAGAGRLAWTVPVTAAGSIAALSGGTFLALAVSMAVMSMIRGWKFFAGYAVVFLLATLVVLPHLPRHNSDVLNRSISIFNDDGDVSRRYAEWQAAVAMIRENPILGVGPGCYQDRIGTFYGCIPIEGGSAAEPDSQNLFLVLAASAGIPALVAFLGMLLFPMARAAKLFSMETETSKKGVYLGVVGSLVAFSVNSVWSPLLVRGIGLPLVIVFALATAGNTIAAARNNG